MSSFIKIFSLVFTPYTISFITYRIPNYFKSFITVFFYNSLIALRSISSALYYGFYTCYGAYYIGIALLLPILLAFSL